MTNFDNNSQRLAAEAEMLMALLDAELYADEPTHPNHIPMPSEEKVAAMAMRAFDRARTIAEAEFAAGGGGDAEEQSLDEMLAEILATWTADLELVSSTRGAATVGEGRLWKVRVSDPDLVAAVFGPDAVGPLSLTVSDVPVADGVAVTVTLPLSREPAPGVVLVAEIGYGNEIRTRIPLHRVDLGEAAGPAGPTKLSGQAVVPAGAATAHPVLTISVLAGS